MNTDTTKMAYTLSEFCTAYGIGRTKAFSEIAEGKLQARKMGNRVIVTREDAQEWLNALPEASAA